MARPSATDRVGRILSMVPWIASQGDARIDDVCDRFGITREELAADLDLVFVVGLYPYTPDSLIEVMLDEEHVSIAYTNFFERPLRLSREEALGILAAGVASRSQPGHDPEGPLARGVAKVADVLGIDLDDELGVVIDPRIAEHHQALDAAARAGRVVHLQYFSHARNEHTERDVEPHRLFATDGAWYLDAHCRATDEQRVFRLDRIDDLLVTDAEFDPPEAGPRGRDEAGAFALGEDLPTVRLEIATEHRWVVEQYPCEDVEVVDGDHLRVSLAISARPWLERLLLRLGPSASVVDGPPDLRDAGSSAARRLLTKYR